MRAQPVAEGATKHIAGGAQRIQLQDELHPVPDGDAQRKHGIPRVEPLHAAHGAQRERHAAAAPTVTQAREAQERLGEREPPGIHEVLLPMRAAGVGQREDARVNLGLVAVGVDEGCLALGQRECNRKLLRARWRAVLAQRMHNRRHGGPCQPGWQRQRLAERCGAEMQIIIPPTPAGRASPWGKIQG